MQLQPQLPDLVLALKPRLVRHLHHKKGAGTRRDATRSQPQLQVKRVALLSLSLCPSLVWLRDMLSPSGPDLDTTLLEVRANETCILFIYTLLSRF